MSVYFYIFCNISFNIVCCFTSVSLADSADNADFSAFPLSFQFYFLSLHCLHSEALLAGGANEGGDLYIGKSVILRFVLDSWNLAVPN